MVTSIGAMVVTLALIIFFGAWAVSSASGAGVSGLASTATAGFTGSTYQAASASSANADEVPRLASNTDVADTWWGKAFLVACPLH